MIELFASDIHFPFEDRQSYKLFLKVVRAVSPHLIFLGGDVADCYAVSKYDKDPTRKLHLQEELDYTVENLAKLRTAAPKAQIQFLEGNHEQRVWRFLQSKAEEVSQLRAIQLPNLLKLDDLGIEWIPNGTRTKHGKLWHIHGNEIGGGGQNPARLKYLRLMCNVIFGHLHTLQSHIQPRYDDEPQGSWANGCMCDLSPDYLHFAHTWVQSFHFIEYARSGLFHVEPVELMGARISKTRRWCYVRGKLFEVGG